MHPKLYILLCHLLPNLYLRQRFQYLKLGCCPCYRRPYCNMESCQIIVRMFKLSNPFCYGGFYLWVLRLSLGTEFKHLPLNNNLLHFGDLDLGGYTLPLWFSLYFLLLLYLVTNFLYNLCTLSLLLLHLLFYIFCPDGTFTVWTLFIPFL